MRLYDTFLFSGELDLLECRLYELQDSDIYKHVIVEGTCTFQGDPKPLYYLEHQERFAPWKDRIRYVTVDPVADGPGKQPGAAWSREYSSREATWRGLEDAERGEDIIIHGDVDEIPSPQAVAVVPECPIMTPFRLALRWSSFAVDWVAPWAWNAVSVAYFGQVPDFTMLREWPWPAHAMGDVPAGWHLTWLGGPEAIRRKVHSFSHVEQIPEIEAGIEAGKYYERGLLWPGGYNSAETQFLAVDVDETWPRYVYERKCPDIWFRPRLLI